MTNGGIGPACLRDVAQENAGHAAMALTARQTDLKKLLRFIRTGYRKTENTLVRASFLAKSRTPGNSFPPAQRKGSDSPA